MDFSPDARADQLREEIHAFLAEHLTPEVRARVAESGNYYDPEFHRATALRGWVGAHWTPEEGGQGWDRSQADVLYETMAAAGAPVEGMAITQIISEAIRRIGTPEQKERFLKPVCRGEIILALGYTEPGSGSDMAAARTRAVRNEQGWLINGQKIFTTNASSSDYVFLLARTDPEAPKHAGLSMFLVPTSAEGFSCTPLWTLSGQRTNLTFYTDLQVGDDALLGEPGQGWEIVNVALAFERGGEFAAQLCRLVNAAVGWAHASDQHEDPQFLTRLGRVIASTEVARILGAHASWSRGSAKAGAVEGSMAKVFGTEALLRGSRSLLDSTGPEGQLNPDSPGSPAGGELQHLYRESQIGTIYGGTSEVLRTLIAQQRLGLPPGTRRSAAK